MSKDQAARIAERAWESAEAMIDVFWQKNLRKAIRRAIASAVRKERERCLAAVDAEAVAATTEKRFVNPGNIIKAINGGKR